MLSGAPPAVDLLAFDVAVEQCELDAGEFTQFEVIKEASHTTAITGHVQSDPLYMSLTIVGTAIEFDSTTGLPAHLQGNIYYVGGPEAGELAGTYSEQLTPIIDPTFGFVGTTGISVFTFVDPNADNSQPLGELTTFNQSFIVGMDPSGGILVQSTGEIMEGTGALKKSTGGMTSSSTVFLPNPGYPEVVFALNVDLTFKFETPPRHKFLEVAGLIPNSFSQHDELDGHNHDRISNLTSCESTVADQSHHDEGDNDLRRSVAASIEHQGQHGPAEHPVMSERVDKEAADLILADWSADDFDDETCALALVA